MKTILGAATAGGSAAVGKAMPIHASPKPLHYALSAFRWHLDSRTPSKVIAIHDYLSTSAAWELFLNEGVASLPLSRLTPTEPLEVYCVDLRGHNSSEAVRLAEDGESFVSASAADVALLQRDILKTEAKLTAVGFGAMVACEAALHAPDSFSTMVLFVRHFSQLFECDPRDYGVRSILRSAPSGAASFQDMAEYLKNKLPNDSERAVLLAAVEEAAGGPARFRFSDELLRREEKLLLAAHSGDAQFNKPVAVFVADAKEKPPTDTDLSRFKRMFPQGRVMQLNAQGKDLGSPAVPMVPLMLQHFNLLGEVTTDNQ